MTIHTQSPPSQSPAPATGFTFPHYATAAQWWDALGQVPLERIVFNPWPGTATDDDVLRLDDHEDRICEMVNGTLVEKAMGYEESLIATEIITILRTFVKPRKLGFVSGEGGMMKILGQTVRIPDVAFVSYDRLPERKRPAKRIPELAPDLAVEVLSKSNTPLEMRIKLREYFAAGTRLFWYVDPKSQSIQAFTSPDAFTIHAADDVLTSGDVLPGFEVRVQQLFDVE